MEFTNSIRKIIIYKSSLCTLIFGLNNRSLLNPQRGDAVIDRTYNSVRRLGWRIAAIVALSGSLACLPRWLALLLTVAVLFGFLLQQAGLRFHIVTIMVMVHVILLVLLTPFSATLAGVGAFASGICTYVITTVARNWLRFALIVLTHTSFFVLLAQTYVKLAVISEIIFIILNFMMISLGRIPRNQK